MVNWERKAKELEEEEEAEQRKAEEKERTAERQAEEEREEKREGGFFRKAGGAVRNYARYNPQREQQQLAAFSRFGSAANATVKEGSQQAVKWSSILLIVLGLVSYALRFNGTSIISWALFIIAGVALSERAQESGIKRSTIFIPMIFFVIWYYIYGGRYDAQFWAWFLPTFGVLLLLPIILSKGQTLKMELLGFIPAAVFFLDLGLISWLVKTLGIPITDLIKNAVLFTPWWTLLGIFTMPSNPTKSLWLDGLLGLTRLAGIVYVLFLFVFAVVPDIGYTTTQSLPSPEEFQENREQFEQQFEGENPITSRILCTVDFDKIGEVEECIRKRQEDAQLESICKDQLKVPADRMEDCIEEQRKQLADSSFQVAGKVDPAIKEPIVFKFTIDEQTFPRRTTANFKLEYTANLEYQNPREQEIKAEISCSFKGKSGVEDLPGIIKNPTRTFAAKRDVETVTCLPVEGHSLKGEYNLVYEAVLHGLKTESWLTRFFIPDTTPAGRLEYVEKIEFSEGKLDQLASSNHPQEFAAFHFGIGNPSTNPVIELDPQRPIQIAFSVENLGKGKLLRVQSYDILLDEFRAACVHGEDITVPDPMPIIKGKRLLGIPGCEVLEIPPSLAGLTDRKEEIIFAEMIYDYKITHEEGIGITEIAVG